MRNQILIGVIGLAVVTASTQLHAAIYKSVDEDGNVVYSDVPLEPEAEKIVLQPINTLPPINVPSGKRKEETPTPDSPYQELVFTQPEHGQSIRENNGNAEIALSITPPLSPGSTHQLVITMDGREISRGTNTRIQLSGVDRGTHTLNALILNPEGEQLIAADSVEFHMLRISVIRP